MFMHIYLYTCSYMMLTLGPGMQATFVASWPISILLDILLGKEIGTIYSRNQLKVLLE